MCEINTRLWTELTINVFLPKVLIVPICNTHVEEPNSYEASPNTYVMYTAWRKIRFCVLRLIILWHTFRACQSDNTTRLNNVNLIRRRVNISVCMTNLIKSGQTIVCHNWRTIKWTRWMKQIEHNHICTCN